jgi:hypothetical protein
LKLFGNVLVNRNAALLLVQLLEDVFAHAEKSTSFGDDQVKQSAIDGIAADG